MGFIHDEHQIRQGGQILIEGIANDLIDLLHIGVFLVELVDVVYEDADIRLKGGKLLGFIVIIRNNLRRSAETAKAAEYILGTVKIRKITF